MAVDHASVTDAAVENIIQNQTWFKKHSNFITSAVGLALTILAWVATQPFGDTPLVDTAVIFIGFLATTLGISVTPNGLSNSQLRRLREEQNRVIAQRPLRQKPVEDESKKLTGLVDDFNAQIAEAP
ncbi:hypothetical protein [Corynebacterium sp. NML120713]|uniref:hypothetical protein n=1 Tax=Corynebacterium sp. NML120713 TaxID=1906332 RepID=UPI0008FB8611|nr:hypothetical protein [Corynebacterium sp. NML120713]OIR43195.1 hypothetical protein BJP06_06340 [Corynebacterium sp. NML120713]